MRTTALLVLALVGLSACVTAQPGPDLTGLAAPCLPAGAPPDVRDWPVTRVWQAGVLSEAGQPVPIAMVRHEGAGRAIVLGWLGGEVAVYDDAPDGEGLVSVNRRWIEPPGPRRSYVARTVPRGGCSWWRPGKDTDDAIRSQIITDFLARSL